MSESQNETNLRMDIVWAGRMMLQKGYVIGTAGNISSRVHDSEMLITPSGAPYDIMAPEDIVLCNFDGKSLVVGKKPSSELALHASIYKARNDVNAIVHTHSIYATSMAVSQLEIPFCLDEQYYSTGPYRVPVAGYARSGSIELANNAVMTLKNKYKAILLANHGVVAVGIDVKEAFDIAEAVEKAAMIYTIANFNGKAISIEKYFESE